MNAKCGSLALLLTFAACASTPRKGSDRVTVEVEGRGTDSAQALADALKRSVEKGLGVKVASTTKVEAAVAVRRRIWAESRGAVETWTVLGERSQDGLKVVRVRSVVRRLSDGESVPPPEGVKVRIDASGPAEAGVRRGFGLKGYQVVERGEAFVVRARSASALLHDARTAPFVSARGKVTVSVVDAASGGVVWEAAREAGGLDTDGLAASALAVENAGEAGGRDAADGLSQVLWDK